MTGRVKVWAAALFALSALGGCGTHAGGGSGVAGPMEDGDFQAATAQLRQQAAACKNGDRGREAVLVRADLDDGSIETVYRLQDGVGIRSLGTVTTDRRYYTGGTKTDPGWTMFDVLLVNLEEGTQKILDRDPFILNPHPQFEPGEGRTLMIQHNRGGKYSADGKLERLVGEEGATLYLLSVPDGKRTESGGAGFGKNPLGHLPLNHQEDLPGPGTSQQVDKEGRGDVVGDVSHHLQRCHGVGDAGEVHLQHIPMQDLHPGHSCRFLRPIGRQGVVELHENQPPGSPQEVSSEGSPSRSDLQDLVLGPG